MKKNLINDFGNKIKKQKEVLKGNKEDRKKKIKKTKNEVKTRVEEKKKELQDSKENISQEIKLYKKILIMSNGIGVKLFLAFAIPVILIAVFGVVSYQKSSSTIVHNYEKSTQDTLNAVSDYIKLGMKTVDEKSIEFLLDKNVSGYYNRKNEEDNFDNITDYRKIKEEMTVAQGTNTFIKNIHIIANIGSGLSTVATLPKGIYTSFIESDEIKQLDSKSAKSTWVGEHAFIDEQVKSTKDGYAISLIRAMSYKNGYIIMDISADRIMESLSSIETGPGSILGFVTADGRELLTDDSSDNVFSEYSYYDEINESNEDHGYSYQKHKGEKYLYMYSKIGDSGAMVCALIPRNSIIGQAKDIKSLTYMFVIFACIFAIVIGSIIGIGITSAISKLMKSISLAAKGDLTVKFETKRKDEFRLLSSELTDMVASMRNLIGSVVKVGTKVNTSADILSTTSEEILASTKDISLTIDDIEKGVVQQAADTDQCLGQMSNLSAKINQVYDSTYEIEQIANNTKSIIGDGIVIVDELSNKTKATTEITNIVINEIEELQSQSQNIGNFVGVINEIAAQTNLLSLNASIEAARAGDAGRGFAVVADEIRKLADQSIKAADEIQGVVTLIQSKTQGTVQTAKKAENIVESQTVALNKTIVAFEDINKHVGNLASNLDNISSHVKGIEAAKEDTLDAIRNISAVSQQTAAASEEVSTTANNQIGSVESLSQSAIELADDAKNLEESIRLFKIK